MPGVPPPPKFTGDPETDRALMRADLAKLRRQLYGVYDRMLIVTVAALAGVLTLAFLTTR